MLGIVGIGAGLVSALLFAVVITGSPLAILLSYVAPLPVFIAALGWNHRAGLVASGVGALAVALALKPAVGLGFLLGSALPCWWIGYLALLGRSEADRPTEWYPLGRILFWIAGMAALITLGGALAISGDFEQFQTTMTRALTAVLGGEGSRTGAMVPNLPPGLNIPELVKLLAALVPYVAGASFVPMIAANLWLAAKAVQMSGRLPRPWPLIPSLALPREATIVLLGAVLVSMMGGFAGLAASALTGALVAAFALHALAAIHEMTLGKSWRMPALSGLYMALLLLLAWLLPLLALFGVADCAFGLRHRFPGRTPPPPLDPDA